MSNLKIKPKSDFKVRNPETGEYLPEEGGVVERSLFWLRRLDDKSVELMTDSNESEKVSDADLL